MRKLKLIFACLLMAVLSIGQVWAADVTYTFSSKSWAATSGGSTANWSSGKDGAGFMNNGIQVTTTASGANGTSPVSFTNVTKVVCTYNTNASKGKGTIDVQVGTNDAKSVDWAYSGSASGTSANFTATVNYTTAETGNVKITLNTTTNSIYLVSVTITTQSSDPEVSVSPDSWDFGTVHASDAASKVFSVSGSNLTAGMLTLAVPEGFSVSPSSIAVDGTLAATNVTVSKNTSTEDDYAGNLSISGGGLASAKTVALTMTVDADPAPTGTFKLFSGDLSEGDYVFVVGGKAMTNTVSSNRLANTDVTISADNKITNPEDAIIWHVAASEEYWTIYNTAIAKYAASTGAANKAAVTATEDDKILWSVEESSGSYHFNNKYNSELSTPVNSKLQRNGDYGWACYAAYSDIKLYKLDDGTPSAPTFSPAGGSFLEAQSVTLSAEAGTTIYYTTDGTAPTASSSVYSAAIPVSATTTIKAIAVKDDKSSGLASATYTIVATEHAGTELDPYSVADAKIVIDAVGTKENAYVSGIVSSIYSTSLGEGGFITFYISADGATSGQQLEAYKCMAINGEAFSALSDVETGATVVITGTLKKFNSTYEFEQNCHLVSYVAPVAPKQSIANDQANPYTVAQALVYAADGVTYDLDDYVYVRGVVYNVASFNNGAMNIFIKDADAENQFELYKCAGINDGSATTPFEALTDVQAGDIVIGYGQLTVFNTTYEFKQGNYLVDLVRPDVPVTGIDLTESTAEVEVGSTVTLHASVVPGNATDQGIVWSVTSGSDKASVDENGVVTGLAEGTAVIRAASHEDATINAECTVTVTAVDPTIHHVTFDATVDLVESAEVEQAVTKSGITVATSDMDGVNNTNSNPQAFYQTFKNGTLTISSTVGYIKKVEFTCEDSYGTAGYGMASDIWTGNAESVELTASVKQVRIKTITVTYKEDNRAAAGLAWNPAGDIELTVGDAFSAPALLNPNNIDAAEITIASDNTDLATVSAGVVSLVADATGTATITATFAGNASYKPATISYTITVSEPNVTFDSSIDHAESGELTITKGGITLSFTSGSLDGGTAEYRLYKSQTMTLSSTDYLIKKIEFTCASGYLASGFADAAGLDKTNSVWTGESNTVELTASNNQVRMTKIKVFYVEDTRAAAGLAWNPAEDITLTVGDAFSAPALLNPNNIAANEITIESSKTTVATVSEGVVSLVENATGTTTITATFAGNATYKPATVSYKIKVNPAHSIYVSPSLNVNFGSVTKDEVVADKSITVTLTGVNAATLTLAGAGASAFTISPAAALTASGDVTISASSATVGTFAATLTISDDDNNAESKVVNLSITVANAETPETPVSTTSKWVAATEIADGMQVLITGVKDAVVYAMGGQNPNNRVAVAGTIETDVFTPGENTMAFTVVAQDGGKYALRTSNGKYLCAASSGSNYLRSQDVLDDNGKWTLTTTSAVANGTYTRNTMFFNSSSTLFACYASTTTTQQPIALYVPQSVTPEPPTPAYTDIRTGLNAGHYYTVCWPKAMTAIKGGTLWSFAGKDASMAYLIQEDAPFVAGRPYIIYATAEKLEAVVDGDDEPAGNNNGLYGTLDYMDASALNLAGATYMLKSDELRPIGTNNHLDANRAYVILDNIEGEKPLNVPAHKVRGIPMQGTESQGVDNINASETPVKMMIDGQLFIIRGEHMFDATGRLVK